MADDLRRVWDKAVRAAELRNRIPGRLGKPGGAVVVSARPGYLYVRLASEGEQTVVIARNDGVPRRYDLPVWLELEHNVYVVTGVDGTRLEAFIGTADSGGGGVGYHTHATGTGLEYEVEAIRLQPGRVKHFIGMQVQINPFRYWTGSAWETYTGGVLDLTSNQPATAGTHAWVLVGVNPATNTAVATTGTAYGYASPLTLDMLDDISFNSYIPLTAVQVRADDTSLSAISKYTAAQAWLDYPGAAAASSSFLGLTDTPSAYTSQAHRLVKVNSGATALEFTDYLDWVNVVDYGATGDGSTDDTSAISSAIAAIPSAGGVLYFPPGDYVTSGGFTLASNTLVLGAGMGRRLGTDAVTQVQCTSATAVLFTVTADWAMFRDIALKNTAGSTPTAGSAIHAIHASDYNQRVDYESVAVWGFYDCIDSQTGAYWVMNRCQISNPVRYGIRIRNTIEPDAGDWAISNSNFNTGTHATPAAAIRIESSGGGKIDNIKINTHTLRNDYNHGIDMSIGSGNATSILLIKNASIENILGTGINIASSGTGTYKFINIIGNEFGLYGNTTGNAIKLSASSAGALAQVVIVGNNFQGGTGTAQSAISLTNVDTAQIGGNTNDDFASMLSQTTCTNITEFGGGGDVATDAIWDAKGDLAVATGSDTAQKLTVGTDGYVLTADSGETTGIKWSAPTSTDGQVLLLFAQVVDKTIANTTTETTLLSAGRGSKTLPANTLAQGTVIRLTLAGKLSDTGAPTLNIKLTVGGVDVCSTGASTLNNTVSDTDWRCELHFTCRTAGASGTIQGGGLFSHDDGGEYGMVDASPVTVDTTGTLAVNVTATWGTASASNTITCQEAIIEQLSSTGLALVGPSGLTATESV